MYFIMVDCECGNGSSITHFSLMHFYLSSDDGRMNDRIV
jgi:hypothetical protein